MPAASVNTMARMSNRATCLLILGLLPASISMGQVVSSKDYDYGPIISRDRTFDGSVRYRALGPLWERQKHADGHTFTAARPVFARVSETNSPRILKEIVWPVATHKIFRNESYWRVLTGFGHDYELDRESRYKNHLIPVFFQGEASDGGHYFAVFPVGGTIREFLGRDRISFALFPLYARTEVNESVSHDVLWPFVSWTTRDEGSRWRVFPFYGQAEYYGHWKKRFVMWPIWTSADFEKTDDGGFIFFPVTGYSRVGEERTYWLAPPFFKWLEGPERRAVNAPWPFFQYESGEQDKLYFWPVWGAREKGATKSGFFLWPVFHASETTLPDRRLNSFRALPFVYADKTTSIEQDLAAEVTARYFKLWPLVSYRREGDASRLRCLELWPLKNTAPVERNFAPLWTIYNRTRAGENYETELLWGIYRNKKGAEGDRAFSVFPLYSRKRAASAEEFSKWNVLAGLFGREVEDGVRRWRVLYFLRFGNKKVSGK